MSTERTPSRTELTVTYIEEFDCPCDKTSTVAPPRGFGAHTQGGGWWRVTWQPVAGATEYQCSHEFGVANTHELHSSIFMVAPGETRSVKVRTLGPGGTASAWVTVAVTVDTHGRLASIATDHQPPVQAPQDPYGLTAVAQPGGIQMRWQQSERVDHWVVYCDSGDGSGSSGVTVTEPQHEITDLGPGRYKVGVVAWRDGLHSPGQWDWVEVSGPAAEAGRAETAATGCEVPDKND